MCDEDVEIKIMSVPQIGKTKRMCGTTAWLYKFLVGHFQIW